MSNNFDKRSSCIDEFELINDKPKSHTLEINDNPVNLFDLNAKGNLVAIPQATHCIEVVVAEINRQLCTWNLFARQNGDIKTSQGGFDFNVGGRRTIRAPDVSFTPKNISCNLTHSQRWGFQGQPFTPTLVVEVSDTEKRSKFEELDHKFMHDYFAPGTAVTLGWLIDPKQKKICVYKRDRDVIRHEHPWEKLDDRVISRAPTPKTSDKEELRLNCPECSAT
ncbi:6911_t:CDS:2 [Dentiscutata erythropus]|uniref:6911_t:CDS:1 n=1 Tax=Dentiscutata erythropus TaxID=1348616 RepID=A0A9N9A510_9GLOM|nr:6911_t:CDS:2 [Dentiscutata erythropus]